jgi:hypothetical protein
MKEDELGGACSRHGSDDSAHKKDTIRMYVKESDDWIHVA